nr:MAG TPA: hypothetical protein [Caudoviricetes sp.]
MRLNQLMEDIKKLYQEAKAYGAIHSKSNSVLRNYTEAVDRIASNSPKEYISNLEYIISSSYGANTFSSFLEKHKVPLSYIPKIKNVINKLKNKNEDNKLSDTYSDMISVMESYENKYSNCMDMAIYFEDCLDDRYLEAYYTNFPKLSNKNVNISKFLERYGNGCIADMIVYTEASKALLENVYDQMVDKKKKLSNNQWIKDSLKDFSYVDNEILDVFTKESLEYQVNQSLENNERAFRESVMMGMQMVSPFTESDVRNMEDYILYQEYKLCGAKNESERTLIMESINRTKKALEPLMIEEDVADSVIPMLPGARVSKPILSKQFTEALSSNTRNKKTGKAPGYLRNNHDLSYGEDDDTDDSDDVGDDIFGDHIDDTSKEKKTSKTEPEPYQYDDIDDDSPDNAEKDKPASGANYYYYNYNYTNSNNTSNKSHNDYSTHTSHDSHDKKYHTINNTNSNNVMKTVDSHNQKNDNSTNKRVHSHDYGDHHEESTNYQEGFFGDLFGSSKPVNSSEKLLAQSYGTDLEDIYDGALYKVACHIMRAIFVQMKQMIESDPQFKWIRENASNAIPNLNKYIDDPSDNWHITFYKVERNGKIQYDAHCNIFYQDYLDEILFDSNDIGQYEDDGDNNKDGFSLINRACYNVALDELDELPFKYHLDLYTPEDARRGLMFEIPNDSDTIIGFYGINYDGYKDLWKEFDPDHYQEKVFTEEVGDADDDKPESDNPIRDTMMDIDRKVSEGIGTLKRGAGKVRQTARVVTKPFKRVLNFIDTQIEKWRDSNENDIKEQLADPHQSNSLIKAFKSAVKYGAIYKAGLLLNPIFIFLAAAKHLDSRNNKFRIRNEMIGELKTELQVLEEKIKDADANKDRKAKYQMMRLKNELTKKLIRVGGTGDMKNMI